MTCIGRDPELEGLTAQVTAALNGAAGRTVVLAGAPGTGKTTLAAALIEHLPHLHPTLCIARGRCLKTFGGGDPYFPFVSALDDLADESTPGFVRKESLSEMLTELAPYWLSVVPVVGDLLGAVFATAARLKGQTPSVAPSREALFVQYLELIKRLAQRSPIVLFLDDLQWADQASVALLAHVCRGIERLPVVVVGTFRMDEADADRHPIIELLRELEREGIGSRVDIGELPPDSVHALMEAEFGGDVSEPLRRWMVQTAGGNPLFISELARLLRQSQAVEERHGEWHLTDEAAQIGVPRSAEAVIESRITRLDAETLRVLQYASVEGNEFDSVVLARLLDADELDLLDQLERVERQQRLIAIADEVDLPNGDTSSRYRFRHTLMQTVLYRQVQGKRRILLHRKAGEVLESIHQNAVEGVAGALARHFHRGNVPESAYRYACSAADAARRVYAHWEAEELLRIALDHAPEAEVAEVEERLGDIYGTVGHYEQGISGYRQALGRDVPGGTALRLRRKAAVLERKAGLLPAPQLLQQVRTLLAEAADAPRERCELLIELTNLPDTADVIGAAQEALQIARRLDDPMLLADALQQLAVSQLFRGGQPTEAFVHLERAQALVTALGDPMRSTIFYCIAGIAHARLGQYAHAQREFEGMLEASERLGEPRRIGGACNNLGAVLLRLGSFAEAEALLRRAYSIHLRRDRATLVQSLFNLAERARGVADFPEALARYAELLEMAREFEYWSSEAIAHAGLGLCHLALGDTSEAEACAWRAVAVVADRESWFEDRDVLELLLARLEVAGGMRDAAASRLARAGEVLGETDIFLWARVRAEQIEILQAHDPAAAVPLTEELVARTATLQSPPLEAWIAELRSGLDGPARELEPSVHE